MFLRSKKILSGTFMVLFTIIAIAAGIFYGSRLVNLPEKKYFAVVQNQVDFFKPRVTSDTILTRQRNYACMDIEVIEKKPAPEDLRDLKKEELDAKFNPAGYRVTFNDSKSLLLTEQYEDICPVHKSYRHLGLFQDRLAIYEGPLGYNEKIIRVESITFARLPNDLQIKLQQAMDFQKQSSLAAENLRQDLEFKTEDVLNAALENIDEHGGELQ